MPEAKRKKIPKNIEEEILFNSNHTCCICRGKRKDVVIHHIDGNNSNNEQENLAVVCLDCHSKITGRRGLGKAFKPGEVKRYKRAWEKQVQDMRKIHRPRIYYGKELISQIDLIVCEILACSKNKPRVEELLDILYELHLWRGNRELDKKIIEGFEHLAIMSGLSDPKVANILAEKAWEMCWHFVGPEDISMNKIDERYIIRCIGILETLALFNSEFARGRKVSESTSKYSENFFEIGIWYSNKKIGEAVLKVYEEGLKASIENKQIKFPSGYKIIRQSLLKLISLIGDDKEKWKNILEYRKKLLRRYKPI